MAGCSTGARKYATFLWSSGFTIYTWNPDIQEVMVYDTASWTEWNHHCFRSDDVAVMGAYVLDHPPNVLPREESRKFLNDLDLQFPGITAVLVETSTWGWGRGPRRPRRGAVEYSDAEAFFAERFDHWLYSRLEVALLWAWEHGAKNCPCLDPDCSCFERWKEEAPQLRLLHDRQYLRWVTKHTSIPRASREGCCAATIFGFPCRLVGYHQGHHEFLVPNDALENDMHRLKHLKM